MNTAGVHYKNFFIHLFLWLGYACLHYYWLSMAFEASDLIPMTLRIVVMHAAIFYINVLILLPLFFERSRYVWYIAGLVVLLLAFYYLFDLSNHLALFRPESFRFQGRVGRFSSSPPRERVIFIFSRRTFTMLLSPLAILFISTTYWMIRQARKRRQWELDLRSENLQSELRFLKSQINPHFLFNALNNIYSMSITQSEKTPGLIMQLSDMLRYMLYENNGRKVPLSQEISYMENYIAFQRLKIEGSPQLSVTFSPENTGLTVEPMIFIPFIENSFKHSNIEDIDHGWISMSLQTTGSRIFFSIGNSLPVSGYTKDPTGGIGLENVQKRLALLYPNKHKLSIERGEDSFWVHLSLDADG